jgi:hypothetical protein
LPSCAFHTLTVLSDDEDASHKPSGLQIRGGRVKEIDSE